MRISVKCKRVRYLWPFNWVPLLPVPIGWFGDSEFGLGLAWLWWRVSVVAKF